MNKVVRVLIGLTFAVILSASSPADAVELIIPDLFGSSFEEIKVPVLVKDFVEIAGVEIHIEFDEASLTLDSIASSVLTNPTVNDGLAGRAHIIWDDFENPLTLPDSQSLVDLYFTIEGDASGDVAIQFFGNIELVDPIGDPYDLTLTNGSILVEPTDVYDENGQLPRRFGLSQNFPNPFNPTTTISYTVDKATELTFEVFNLTGQLVYRFAIGRKPTGVHSISFSGDGLPSGIYTYRLSGGGTSLARQMILLK